MKQKKKLWLLLLAAVLIIGIVSWIAYMEIHHGGSALVRVRMTEDEILEEMPELAITEQDEALQQAVLAMPQVQNALAAANQAGADAHALEISLPEAQAALDTFLPGGHTKIVELCVMNSSSIYLTVLHSPEQRTSWHFDDGTIHKTIAVYHVHEGEPSDLKASYSNDHDGIHKDVLNHLWFSWLGH